MSEAIKKIVGEDVYKKILEAGLKSEDFDIIKDDKTSFYVPMTRFNQINSENNNNKKLIKDYEKNKNDVNDLLKDNEDLKSKYDTLNTTFETNKTNYENELKNINKKSLIEKELLKGGIISDQMDFLVNGLKLDDYDIDKKGNLTGFNIEDVQKERPIFFQTKTSDSGNNNTGGKGDDNDDNVNDIFDELIKYG